MNKQKTKSMLSESKGSILRRTAAVQQLLRNEKDETLVHVSRQKLRFVRKAAPHQDHIARPQLVAPPLDGIASAPFDQHHDLIKIVIMQLGHGAARITVMEQTEFFLQIAPVYSIFLSHNDLPYA